MWAREDTAGKEPLRGKTHHLAAIRLADVGLEIEQQKLSKCPETIALLAFENLFCGKLLTYNQTRRKTCPFSKDIQLYRAKGHHSKLNELIFVQTKNHGFFTEGH